MTEKQTCTDCGCEYPKRSMRRGRCSKCIRYEKKHGVKRPPDLKTRETHCRVCGEEREWGSGGYGLCKQCYYYRLTYGYDRDMSRRPNRKPGEPYPTCRYCRIRLATYAPRQRICNTCATYMRNNNGKKRPRYLDAEACLVCGKPKNDANFIRGRCRACDEYLRDHGIERPEHLWKSAHGWCDCGKTATHTEKINVHGRVEHMRLCDECHAEYQRQVKWYGPIDITGNISVGVQRKATSRRRQQPDADH